MLRTHIDQHFFGLHIDLLGGIGGRAFWLLKQVRLYDWGVSGSHSWFQYSDSNSAGYRDYDYEEWSAAIHYSDYTSLVYASVDELWGFDSQQDTLSLILRFPFSAKIVGEAEIGQVNNDSFIKLEYQFARINLGYVHKQWSAQLQYHYSSSDAEQLYRKDRVGSQWLAKLAYHFTLL